MKKINLTLIAIGMAVNFLYAQNINYSTQTFSYDGNTVYHYGLGWYTDPDASAYGPMAYLSAYGGIKFFTEGGFKAVLDVNGNLGIGTNKPTTALQIGNFSSGSSNNQLLIPGTYNFEQVRLGQIGNGNSALEFVNHTAVSSSYGIKFLVNVDGGAPGLQLQYAPSSTTYSGLSYTTGLYMDLSGNIAIGTTNNYGYKLAVNGTAIATSMTVKAYANWPDYVFKKDYQLPPLTDIKTYIDQNHHLPEMPSQQQIAKDGLNLGEMNKLLVKKVEELTLYLIDKDNEVKAQSAQLKSQQDQINKLSQQVQYLLKTSEKH